jgi:DMSO/TMAO reductase YedYZ molybdopterin-dependent catalytic subunit
VFPLSLSRQNTTQTNELSKMTAQQLGKHHMMIVHKTYPFNAEPPKELLCSSYITPVELFYVRNHGNIPTLDANKYRLVVQGLVEKQLVLSLDDIKSMSRLLAFHLSYFNKNIPFEINKRMFIVSFCLRNCVFISY